MKEYQDVSTWGYGDMERERLLVEKTGILWVWGWRLEMGPVGIGM